MMREKQKELNGSIREVMDQMAERRYGKKTDRKSTRLNSSH